MYICIRVRMYPCHPNDTQCMAQYLFFLLNGYVCLWWIYSIASRSLCVRAHYCSSSVLLRFYLNEKLWILPQAKILQYIRKTNPSQTEKILREFSIFFFLNFNFTFLSFCRVLYLMLFPSIHNFSVIILYINAHAFFKYK